MRAFRVNNFGSPPKIESVDHALPGPGEIGVEIRAAALNFADLLICEGKYQEIPPLPVTLGLELAGTVDVVGPGNNRVKPGDRVAIFAGHGGLADYGIFDSGSAVLLPDAMPFEDAAAFQIAYGTAHLALDHRARLRPYETLAVLGAAGGVGLTAVEIGKRLDARVIAVARGKDKLEIARQAGADYLIDSECADLRDELKALGGADVVFDAVGGDQFTAAFGATRPGGRIVVIGFASGSVPMIPANHLLVKNIDILGVYWGGYLRFAPDILSGSLKTLFNWYIAGGLRPHISAVLPLERAAEGLEMLRSRRAAGKIVITP